MFPELPFLHIGIDARCLNTTHLRGMGKYVSEMLSHVGSTEELKRHFFSDRPGTIFRKPLGVAGEVELFDVKGYRLHSWEQVGLPWRAWRTRIHLLHCTATTLPYWQPTPTIVTVHDTLPWQIDGLKSYENWYRNSLIPSAFKRCAGIITISESSRKDILNFWPWL